MRFCLRAGCAAGLVLLLAWLADADWILRRHSGPVVIPGTVYRVEAPPPGGMFVGPPKQPTVVAPVAADSDPNRIQAEIDAWREYMRKRSGGGSGGWDDATVEFGFY